MSGAAARSKSSRPPRSRWRTFAGKATLLLVTSAVCLVFLEFAVRWLFPYFDPHTNLTLRIAQMTTNGLALGVPMTTCRLAQPRGDYDTTVRFNEDGFRDVKTLREATSADWFAVGDSFTMGWGVEESERFGNLFEEKLKGCGQPAHVFNLALPENIVGYGRYLKYAESRGPKVQHVLVGLCMENDLHDYRDGKSQCDLAGRPAPNNRPIRNWFKHHLALYTAVSFCLQKSPFISRQLEKFGVVRTIDAFNPKAVWDEAILRSSRDELLKVVSGRDAIILIIPSRRLWHGDNSATERRIHEAFVRLLREANLRVVDMAPALEKTGSPLAHYFTADPHWNKRGHALAAERLLEAQIGSATVAQPQ